MSIEDLLAVVTSERLRQVALHWATARGPRPMPGWKDIDPIALAPQLPIVWSWKYDAATGGFVGRLAGEDINAIFGRPLRGATLEAFFAGPHYEHIAACYRRVVTGPAFMRQSGTVFDHAGRYGQGERIILPLAADGLHPDGLIGATTYRADRGAGAVGLPPAPSRVEDTAFFALD